ARLGAVAAAPCRAFDAATPGSAAHPGRGRADRAATIGCTGPSAAGCDKRGRAVDRAVGSDRAGPRGGAPHTRAFPGVIAPGTLAV
ncbi:MAG: hypothetical protein AVDCRST_MAG26-956, partial [uncultured Chloroflexia bacterium]